MRPEPFLRLLPQSLLWRAFLLIATLMLAAVAAWLAIFSEAELDRRSRQIAQMVTSMTNITRAALLAASPERRRDLLHELSDREGVRVYPADAGDDVRPPPPFPLTRRIEALLRERLGPETRLAFGLNDERGLFVRFRVYPGEPHDDGDFWLALPRERLERHFPRQWLGWGAAVLLLSLAGAWLIVFRITRPLKALETAAAKVGAGETPPPLPERGPREIAALTRAFNRMSADLRRLEEDRALLLAGISHDLRTPLARLRMETEMSVADPQARAGMEADIVEMDRTIGQFLDFARPDAATPAEPVDLAALLAEIADRYGRRVAGADFRATVATVRRDALRRAIVNLVENDLRHGGGAPVELALNEENGEAVVAVLDRGPGMTADEAARLRQPFARGETARTGAGGAGLGLAIVERVVRAEGGRLELLAREGGGLAARIVLPRA
jgi:two-component system osmolarity sensor histidine kinase EnvZ